MPTLRPIWRRFALPVAVVVVAGVATWLAGSGRPHMFGRVGSDGLACAQPVHDFGSLSAEAAVDLKHQFLIRNDSDRPIRITKVDATCGCSETLITKDPVPPGQSVPLDVKANWAGRAGPQEVFITLQTDRAPAVALELRIEGFVKVPATVLPQYLGFGVLSAGERKTRYFELAQGTDLTPFHLLEVVSPNPCVEIVRVDARGKPMATPLCGGPGRFAVTITSPRERGRLAGQIILRTDLPVEPYRALPVTAEFAGAITAYPRSLLFAHGSEAAQSSDIREVIVSVAGRKPTEALTAKVIARTEARSVFDVLEIRPAIVKGGQLGHIIRVAFLRKEATSPLTRGVLRIEYGADQLDVPLIALGDSAKR